MKDIIYKDSNGNMMNVSVIGFFSISELEKEFVMYGLVDDDKNNEDGHVLLGEVIRNDDDVQIVGILPDEKELVVAYYNEISTQIGEEDDDE